MIDLDYELWFLREHMYFARELYLEFKTTREQYNDKIEEYMQAREVLVAAGARFVSREEGLLRWPPKTDAEILASLEKWHEELKKRGR